MERQVTIHINIEIICVEVVPPLAALEVVAVVITAAIVEVFVMRVPRPKKQTKMIKRKDTA